MTTQIASINLQDSDVATPHMWVFGYGSLIWNPEFAVAERRLARLHGWRRSFCMRSVHHRGTHDAPGLVLALDRADGAVCDGVAFRVPSGAEAQTLEQLRARELISSAYRETRLQLHCADGVEVHAIAYVIEREHEQYCADLTLAEQARIIAAAVGGRGPNAEYLFSTAAHLAQLGIPDPDLETLSEMVRAITGPVR